MIAGSNRWYRWRQRGRAGILALLIVTSESTAQEPAQGLSQIRWPLLDMVLLPDSCAGLTLLVAPNPNSTVWARGVQLVRFGVDPIEALQWSTLARRLVESDSLVPAATHRAPGVTPPLRPRRGQRFVLLAINDQVVQPEQRFILLVSDTTANTHWKAFASSAEVEILLTALETAARRSHLRPSSSDSTAVLDEEDTRVERAASVVFIPPPEYPKRLLRQGRIGRVWIEYVVGANGRAEEGSFRPLLSDDPLFTQAAVQALLRAKYQPAWSHGAPVRQRVFQVIAFRIG